MVKDNTWTFLFQLAPTYLLCAPYDKLSESLNKTFPSFHTIDREAHTMAFITPVVEHWLK